MTGKRNQNINGSVWKMALKQFSDATTKSAPEITGGCVVTTIAGLAITLLIMPLEISARKNKDLAEKNLLKDKISVLKKIKKHLIKAADGDLELFNQYRFLKAVDEREDKLKYRALVHATKSPLKVASLVGESFSATSDCVRLCHESVISDVKAGVLLLHASFNAILALASSNMSSLKEGDIKLFEDLRSSLIQKVSPEIDIISKRIDACL
ncbi:cyclodeaminase/cyclohydrolase family protein [Desertivirga brevis]|uniref:cyclodeaminase/cyclohydrolase family protein n=1 Tax=Desertivirga brevis TaxID=2810310 RepID=UPI001A95C15D|nr:cyclodeaminase/cyclohydrolase family protein [Pedobacter sp. SYSU D00873]